MNKLLLFPFILFLCFAHLHTHHACGQSGELVLKETGTKDYKFLFYRGFNGNRTLQLSAADLESLTINSGAGNVMVIGHDLDEIKVEASITVSATSPDKAVHVIKKFMRLSLTKGDRKAVLRSYFDFHERNNFQEVINPNGFFTSPVRGIDLIVNVPKNLEVTVNDRSGDVTIKGIDNNLSVTDGSGNLRIKDINGNLRVTDSSGDLELTNINIHNGVEKIVKISDNSGAMSLDGIRGNISLTDKSGNIDMKRITGNVTLRDTSGGLYIGRVDGNMKLVDSSGDIKVDGVGGNLTLHDSSGGIYVNDVNGDLTLSDNSGDIYVNYVAKNVHVHGAGSGNLRIKSFEGKISGDLRRLYR